MGKLDDVSKLYMELAVSDNSDENMEKLEKMRTEYQSNNEKEYVLMLDLILCAKYFLRVELRKASKIAKHALFHTDEELKTLPYYPNIFNVVGCMECMNAKYNLSKYYLEEALKYIDRESKLYAALIYNLATVGYNKQEFTKVLDQINQISDEELVVPFLYVKKYYLNIMCNLRMNNIEEAKKHMPKFKEISKNTDRVLDVLDCFYNYEYTLGDIEKVKETEELIFKTILEKEVTYLDAEGLFLVLNSFLITMPACYVDIIQKMRDAFDAQNTYYVKCQIVQYEISYYKKLNNLEKVIELYEELFEIKKDMEDAEDQIFIENFKYEQENSKLNIAVNKDPLTNCNNRYAFENMKKQLNKDENYSLILYDLDKFKEINDNYGHAFGDEVIKAFGHILNSVDNDKISSYRIGGDEFIIIAKDLSENDVLELIDTISMQVEKNMVKGVKYSATFGYSSNNNLDFDQVYEIADKSLYENKNK